MAVTFDPELVADRPAASKGDVAVPRGLPAPLPRGESILWQGAPDRGAFAREVFHTRAVALYFAAAALWQWAIAEGDAVPRLLMVGAAAAATLLILHGLAWLAARTTVYTITSARIVMRIGAALPKTIDVPFGIIEGVGLKANGGTGNVTLDLGTQSKVAYALLWPHARPWHWREPQPMLRALPDAECVGRMLAARVAAATPAREHTTPAPEDAFTEVDEHANTAPRPLVLALIGLVLASLALAGWARWTGNGVGGDYGEPVREIALNFVDAENASPRGWSDGFTIVGEDGATIAAVGPGREGLLRNARRAFATRRTRAGLSPDAPVVLTLWDSGRLSLHDPDTGQNVRLDFFGRAPDGPLRTLHEISGYRTASPAAQ